MLFEFMLFALVGIIIGFITGMIPGFHVNNAAIIMISLLPTLGLLPLEFAVILISAMIVHQFMEFIPTLFLGAPQEETVLSLLPAQRLILEGKAMDAAYFTLFGALFGLFFALILAVFAFLFLPVIYETSRNYIVFVLIIIVAALLLYERKTDKILTALFVFMLSGYFGLMALNLNFFSSSQVLFPVFAGLFGLSTLLVNVITYKKGKQISQLPKATAKPDKNFYTAGFLGSFAGMIAGTLPGISASQIGTLMAIIFGNGVGTFMVSVSAINLSNSIFSLIAIYTIGNARSGVAVMIDSVMDITFGEILLFIGIILFVSFFAVVLFHKTAEIAVKWTGRINSRNLNIFSFILICVALFVLTGIYGIFVALVGMCIGLISIFGNVNRTHAMGVLLVPTILFFLGIR
ncbi:MAG: hypothetical protein COV98_01500 [Candidatus Altarchaeum sp. CG12_big_fil_rev_8_21_14_0_65_33_22]|nr:MAG: hypothetical protein COV98_01500 [Candidatus Altarchaeum sp. CG12_big_fil_rev_8_21_14_0_65_33_22]